MSDDLVATVAARLARLSPPGEVVLLAVSGGPDSVAMLDLCWRGRERHQRPLEVVHVDHGIDPASRRVSDSVEHLAEGYGLVCHVRRLALGPDASETAARRARREAFRVLRSEIGASRVALAHHADDQVETVLLRVLRGSGPAGLAGMAPRRGPWIRPLLELSRASLQAHLAAHGLSAWQDPANRDARHLRSWLRSTVLPLLESRDHNVRERLLELSAQAARDRRAWNSLPERLAALELEVEGGRVSVAAAPLLGYRSELQHAVLAALGRRFGVPLGRRRVARIVALLAGGRSGRRVRLAAGLEAELAFDRLLLRRPAAVAFPPVELPAAGEAMAGPHRFRCRAAPAGQVSRQDAATALAPGRYQARSWQPGDRIRPLGGTGSRSVAVLLRESRVAAGRRMSWPVVVADDATIVWVPGICRSGERLPPAGKEALHVECDLA